MRLLLHRLGVVAAVLLAGTGVGLAQPPTTSAPGEPLPALDAPAPALLTEPPDLITPPPAANPEPAGPATPQDLERCVLEIEGLRKEQAVLQAGPLDDEQKKKIDLLQKQVEVLEKMIKLLAEQLKKQPATGPAVDKLQIQAATLEARSVQAARRDQELATAVDGLREHQDALERYGPWLPSFLKELFLPSGTNESPLSIYGQFLMNYTQINEKAGQFSTPDFAPYFLLKLNEQFFLEANIDISNAGVAVSEAQVDWIVCDWLTIVAGRYITPIGFFNERLNHEWINRLPDVPIMFQQAAPLIDTDGIQFRGSTYLGCTPVKLEYSLYGGNGFQFATAPTTFSAVADLNGLTGMPDEVDAKALGGRIGIWVPCIGFQAGVSAYYQNEYSPSLPSDIRLYDFDLNYRKGNWDARFEYAQLYQQARAFIGNDIVRTGLYAQVAYRPYDCPCRHLSKLEIALRYSMARFRGIDQTMLDPTAFGSPLLFPVDRDQWTFGLSYYFYPSMALRFAYEINHQLVNRATTPQLAVNDNVFLAQFVWSF
jgi:hypothetical protein